jgi:hypothetical protein
MSFWAGTRRAAFRAVEAALRHKFAPLFAGSGVGLAALVTGGAVFAANRPESDGAGTTAIMERKAAFAALPVITDDDDKRLVALPEGGKLRADAAKALEAMRAEARASGFELRVASGWRRRPWATRAEYERDMIARYGSVSAGAKLVAWDSYHHRGVAVDFGSDGLEPVSKTIGTQRKTKAFAWLSANAARFGFAPYEVEPWHWEFRPVGLDVQGAGVA